MIVADEHLFYNQADYVFGDLKIREHGIPLSMISFSFTHRKDR